MFAIWPAFSAKYPAKETPERGGASSCAVCSHVAERVANGAWAINPTRMTSVRPRGAARIVPDPRGAGRLLSSNFVLGRLGRRSASNDLHKRSRQTRGGHLHRA